MTILGFGLRESPGELILLVLLILLLFGSKRIPDLARSLGRSIGEFKKGRAEGEQEAREAAAKKEDAGKKDETK
jgi:sec-independent protein translocase protein TatA